jgi:hypothetical protein
MWMMTWQAVSARPYFLVKLELYPRALVRRIAGARLRVTQLLDYVL